MDNQYTLQLITMGLTFIDNVFYKVYMLAYGTCSMQRVTFLFHVNCIMHQNGTRYSLNEPNYPVNIRELYILTYCMVISEYVHIYELKWTTIV